MNDSTYSQNPLIGGLVGPPEDEWKHECDYGTEDVSLLRFQCNNAGSAGNWHEKIQMELP